jgi:dihydroneopterin aldolase/2-amino-4-hydroxy-6-hydroxymethyldihydropteridine diphosphokinase
LVNKNRPSKVFIGIGSNLGNKEENICKAIKLIGELDSTEVIDASSFYKTSPVGFVDQDWFINAVIKIKTYLPPNELMSSLLSIESSLGRIRKEKWGARTIDLDILFYGNIILNEEDITVPHPHLHERKFVLEPFCEIEPEFVHPVYNKSILRLCNELQGDERITKLKEKCLSE